MNVNTIKGTVQSHTKKAWNSDKFGTMMNNSITVNTASGNVTVHKNTKPETNFELESGTLVQVSYDAIERTGSKGKYTVNNIIQDGLVILSSDAKNDSSITYTNPTSFTTVSSSPHKAGSYDSNGARNGMITGNAVQLAKARSKLSKSDSISLDDLKLAASDVLALTFFVESGAKPETKIKKPLAVVKKVSKKKEELVTSDEDDFSFDD